jgi:hypothetical protein
MNIQSFSSSSVVILFLTQIFLVFIPLCLPAEPTTSKLLEVVVQGINGAPVPDQELLILVEDKFHSKVQTDQNGNATTILPTPYFQLICTNPLLWSNPLEPVRFNLPFNLPATKSTSDSEESNSLSINDAETTFTTPTSGLLQVVQIVQKNPSQLTRKESELLVRSFERFFQQNQLQQFAYWKTIVPYHESEIEAKRLENSDQKAEQGQNPALSRQFALATLRFSSLTEPNSQSIPSGSNPLAFFEREDLLTSQTLVIQVIDEAGQPANEGRATLILSTPQGSKIVGRKSLDRSTLTFSEIPTTGFARVFVESTHESEMQSGYSPVFSLTPRDQEIPSVIKLLNAKSQLQGHVLGVDELPISNALIEAYSNSGFLQETSTDELGFFNLWPLNDKPILIKVTINSISQTNSVLYERRLFLDFSSESSDLLIPFPYLELDDSTQP